MWIGTWNVNGKKVEEDISKWLFAGGSQRTDIFVLGLQEMVDLTASTVVSESQSQKRSQMWLEMVQTALRPSRQSEVSSFIRSESQKDDYYCVSSKILVGVFLCVFAHVSLRPSIQDVMSRFLSILPESIYRRHWTARHDG